MIRLKQTMGNVIKGKIEPEQVILKYECALLNSKSLVGLLTLQADGKGNSIIYSGDVKKNLATQIQSGLEEKELYDYICQTVQTVNDIKKLGLNPQNLILNPEWIYLTKDEKRIKFIYCPVNGMSYKYDSIVFLHELVFQAALNANEREGWDKWLAQISKTGLSEKSIVEIERYRNMLKGNMNDVRRQTIFDEDGEALTGLEEMPVWETKNKMEDEEAPTGVDFMPEWMNHTSGMPSHSLYDEDGEALTGTDYEPEWMEGTNIFTESGMGDGTYTEATSEPFSQSGLGYTKTPTLLRRKTGESVQITKDNFKLGRSEQRADFCIRNNSGISNIHAVVIKENNKYYLKDHHSTNGTYVNGEKILDSTIMVPLHDGSIIQLYDEEIVFKL